MPPEAVNVKLQLASRATKAWVAATNVDSVATTSNILSEGRVAKEEDDYTA